jgi:4'-phosphopantetheinyl transferase
MDLSLNEVHVWRANIAESCEEAVRLRDILTDDERARADRFHFERDQQRSIASRGMLRVLLGKYLQRPAGSIAFELSEYGKPFLPKDDNNPKVFFNTSHAGDLVLAAFARERLVGVDVEPLREIQDADRLVERFFSPSEVAEYRLVHADERRRAFLNGWTRKEAFIKAHGEGLSLSLKSFDVSLTPGRDAALLGTRLNPDETQRWSLLDLPLDEKHVGALAVEGHGFRLSCWRFAADCTLQ